MSTKRSIHLPALPDSWNRLSTRELEEVQKFLVLRERDTMRVGPQRAAMVFKFRCFVLFLNLRVRQKTIEDNGETVFLFRRRGLRHLFETIPMRAWQVTQWINGSLKFLDDLFARYTTPYEFVRLFGKRFKGPTDLLTSLTYMQYSNAQNLLVKYWETEGVISVLKEKKRKPSTIRQAEKRSEKIQCKFLAVLFNVPSRETEIRTECSSRKVDRKVWAYDNCQINNWKYFRFACRRMFPVMLQYFQSVQSYYSKIYPDLFTDKSTSNSKRKGSQVLIMEVDSMNQIMKYAGFSNYQDIYNSHAVFILGVLNDMNKYAKSIEEMNARHK